MQVVEKKAYCFAEFTLDLRRGSLRRDGREIELRPKSFSVLCYFVENAGRLLTRDELMDAIWPDVVVTDESLTHCISDVRAVLGDGDQRIIKTVLRRGYTFRAPVTELAQTEVNGRERRQPERRQLTILFCDLVGSTALSAQLDPEDLHELMGSYHRACAREIGKAGGFVAEHWGDAVVAYFGYPRAQEDDAERAIRAALALIDMVRDLALRRGGALQIRVGIATGLVVIGDVIAAGDARVAGETPVVAARLQGLAEPGRIVVANSTRQLAGDLFDYRDLGAVALRGRTEPVQAWEVTGASALQSRFEAKHGTRLTPLVDRDKEIELLLRRWRQAQSGVGRVVVVTGEAGIGKSRLAVELRERLRFERHTTVQFFCSPHHMDSPFQPVIAQIEHAAGVDRGDAPEARLEKLASLVAGNAPGETDLPLLSELLSIAAGDRRAIQGWSARRKRNETLAALLRQFERASRRQPVLAIFEDVHWIDPSSQELLDMLVERATGFPLLLVVTCRPEYQGARTGGAPVSRLMLSRLGPEQSAVLAGRVAGNRGLADDVVAEIATRSDGIPLFVEELTKATLDAEPQAGEGASAAANAPPRRPVPDTLQRSLMARLDHLGGPANEVADAGAAIGREFSYELLAAVTERNKDQLSAALERLADAGLVHCRGTPPQATCLFKHALLRDAVYDRLMRSRRRSLHARIARTIEQRFPERAKQEPQLLALHWTEAAVPENAVAYWVEASRLARDRYALAEAIVHARKGLALASGLEAGAERWRAELKLETNLGWALYHAKGEGTPEVGAAFSRARALCDRVGERATLGPILYAQATYHIALAEFESARRAAEELLRLAGERGDVGFEITAHAFLARSFYWCGDYVSAAAHFARLVAEPAPGACDEFRLAGNTRAAALPYAAVNLVRLGHLDQAVARRDQALALARKRYPYVLGIALSRARNVDMECGRHQLARACLDELAALGRELRFPLFTATADLHRAVDLSVDGEVESGLALARRAVVDILSLGRAAGQTGTLLLLAECCERAGRVDEALEVLDKGLDVVEATGERPWEAELHRLRGQWLAAHRPLQRDEAEACYRRALAVARPQQAKFWELRAATGLAGLWRDQGKRHEARALLAPIHGWFTEGLDTPDLRAAKTLLTSL